MHVARGRVAEYPGCHEHPDAAEHGRRIRDHLRRVEVLTASVDRVQDQERYAVEYQSIYSCRRLPQPVPDLEAKDLAQHHNAAPFVAASALAPWWRAMTLKYTSSRSGSAATNSHPGGDSAYTSTSVRPASSLVQITRWRRSTSARSLFATRRFQTRPRSAAIAASGSASRRISPLSMMAMRLHSSATSSTMCVERITTACSPISLRRLRKRTRSAGSSPAVGSSTMMSEGPPRSATAIPKRWRMPPEYPPCLLYTS